MATFPTDFTLSKRIVLQSDTLTNNSIYLGLLVDYTTITSPINLTSNVNPNRRGYMGIFKVTNPDGTELYKNAFWDVINDSTTFLAQLNTAGASSDVYVWNNTVGSAPQITNTSFNYALDTFTQTDGTEYPMLGTYTVECKFLFRDDTSPTPLYYYIDKDTDDQDQYTFDLNDYVRPTAEPSTNFDTLRNIGICTDDTVYTQDSLTYTTYSLTRALKLYYPNGIVPVVSPNPITSTSASITATPINSYLGTWTFNFRNILITTFTTDWYVNDLIISTTERQVASFDLCNIRCGLDNLYSQYFTALTNNQTLAERLQPTIFQLLILEQQYQMALACGDGNSASTIYLQILAVGKISEDCDCGGESNTTVGASNYVIVDNTDGTITVTETISGALTTYTLSIANDSITTAMLQALSVTSAKLASNSVTSAKIADGNVTVEKLEVDAKRNMLAITLPQSNLGYTFTIPVIGTYKALGVSALTLQAIGGGTVTIQLSTVSYGNFLTSAISLSGTAVAITTAGTMSGEPTIVNENITVTVTNTTGGIVYVELIMNLKLN